MSRYVTLAQSEVTASALGAWLELLGEGPLDKGDARRIVWDRGYTDAAGSVHAYEHLVSALSCAIQDDPVHHPQGSIAVLVDSASPAEMSAIADGGPWNHLLAMLILTFPELRWHFGCLPEEKDSTVDWRRHRLPALFASQPWDPTFDPTGLRNWIRKRTNETLKSIEANMALALRQHKAAVIDEETDYARVHGLTAYRFGLRADLVTTWASMSERFRVPDGGDAQGPRGHGYDVLLEDMSLNFPDRQPKLHLLDLETERAVQCQRLSHSNDDSKYRILITTGQSEPGKDTLRINREFLRAKRSGRGKTVFKPASGMFDLWKQAGLLRRLPSLNRLGNYDGFVWPPDKPRPEAEGEEEGSNHGAPGKLLMIADQLLHRAECLHDNIHEAADAVLGAVLATDALELTGGRTPTTALQALALKHEFEVMAECRFSGVEYHIAVKPRLEEIDREVQAIGFWFHRSQRMRAMLNARMHIFSRLVKAFNDHHQYDEEQTCMNRARHIHNTLWMRQNPAGYLLWPMLRYVEILIGSFSVFAAVIVAWILGLAGLYWIFHEPTSGAFVQALEDSITSFFSVGGPIHHGPDMGDKSFGYVAVICFAIVSGFVHLGIFISHLYSMLSRK